MRFTVLGPVGVLGEQPGSPQQRGVLAVLLLSEGRHVTLQDIVSALWGSDAPGSAVVTTRTYISRLRRVLHDVTITSTGGGYRLAADPSTVDVTVFRQMLRAARDRSDPVEASRLLRGALSLWRGPALDGLGGAFFESRRTWLEQLRATAEEDLWALDIALGNNVAAELTAATTAEPFRERLWELLIDALVREGRHDEACAAYHRITRLLDERLGLRPGPGLRLRVDRSSTQPA